MGTELYFLAYRYLLQYRSDDTFDNTYVDDNLRALWRDEETKTDFPELTPLRNWEEDEKYQVSTSTTLTKNRKVDFFFVPPPINNI